MERTHIPLCNCSTNTGGSNGDQSGHAHIRSVDETCPQSAKILAWADGHWTIYNTHHDNKPVRLLNLLSPDAF